MVVKTSVDNFMKEALRAAQNITPTPSSDFHTNQISGVIYIYPPSAPPQKSEINSFPYIETLTEIIRKYRKNYSDYSFDVIFAARMYSRKRSNS